MTRHRDARATDNTDTSTVDEALEHLDAPALRDLLRQCLKDPRDQGLGWLESAIIERAARSAPGWSPEHPTARRLEEIKKFAAAARRVGSADPADVDTYLREASHAFLAKDYQTTVEISRALLIPAAEGDIDLGQYEMIEDVLETNLITSAAQFVVSVYMTTEPARRVEAVLAATDDVSSVGYFATLLEEMEAAAIEPLPDLEGFLPPLLEALEARVSRQRETGSRGWEEERWLRALVSRLEGTQGLARVALESKRFEDLNAWCRALVEAGDWEAAFEAHGEAARLVTSGVHAQGAFLDGVVQAAQALQRDDLDDHLARAWKLAPSMARLQRWLATTSSATSLRARADEALEACPATEHQQRALLHIVRGALTKTADLLRDAPGQGWSGAAHPGHLVFKTFYGLLGGRRLEFDDVDMHRHDLHLPGWDARPLHTPSCDALIDLAALTPPAAGSATRSAMLAAMRAAAAQRLDAAAATKRRQRYGHAVMLAVACTEVDPTPEARAWLADLRSKYNRFSALQREFRSLEA